MFRPITDDAYDTLSSAGARPLCTVGAFVFEDTMDEAGALHHVILEQGDSDEGPTAYEADQPTMYELLARYLAGEYEKTAYELEQSPAHHALLDLLELAAARARSGDTDFTLSELDGATEDLLEDEQE